MSITSKSPMGQAHSHALYMYVANGLSPLCPTDRVGEVIEVGKGAKIRNRYNQVPHLTQDANGKVTDAQ